MTSTAHLQDLLERAASAPTISESLLDELAVAVEDTATDPRMAYWHGLLLYNYHQELGLEDRSIEAFERAIEVDPNDVDARYLLGCAYFDHDDYERSRQCLSAVLADPRLAVPLQRWRWLKATELVTVARVRLGEISLESAMVGFVKDFVRTEEEDRPLPTEMRRLVDDMGFPERSRFAALWE